MDSESVDFQIPAELQKKYIFRRIEDIKECLVRLQQQDWSYFERLGHQLKGHAPSYGHPDLGEIAIRIESSATRKNIDDLKMALGDFQGWSLSK